jgi:outer membrane protein OmpA-like peptidoglycan-associated protein
MGIVLIAASALVAVDGSAQMDGEQDTSNLSRPMRTAILFYERGDEMQAMDRFMEILTKGDPAERPMANEYISLITQRMNAGSADFKAPPRKQPSLPVMEERVPKAAAPRAVTQESAPRPVLPQAVIEAEAVAPAPPPAASRPVAAPRPRADKELMKKETKAKIRTSLEKSLKEIKAVEDVRLVMMENGDPLAIGIPSPLLFSSGISFQKSAGKLLDSVSRLVYALGGAKVFLLPEGSAVGDAKVLDMRRAMGVSAHLFSAGIAPARVKVNLLNSQVDIPKAMQDFKGILLVFVYNEPLGLAMEGALGDEAGPPLSLGASSPAFRPERGEGVIIEFSVSEPPSGLVSWKFQLLQPLAASRENPAPLQEVLGGGPVFHQIYWNGRQNYFGALLPAGRYECVLTATDAKNRQRTLHRWIELLADKAPAVAPAARAPVPAPVPPEPVKADVLVEEVKQKLAAVEIGRKKRASKAAAAKTKAAAPKPVKPASGSYELGFNKGTHQLTPEGEKLLAKVAQTVSYYPLENLKLIGCAEPSEPDSLSLAERRAQMVAGLLINKYQVEPKKIQVNSKVAQDQGHKVEVYFVGNE